MKNDKTPPNRNPVARDLASAKYRQRKVKSKKTYSRKPRTCPSGAYDFLI
jgi:hypothetical protein